MPPVAAPSDDLPFTAAPQPGAVPTPIGVGTAPGSGGSRQEYARNVRGFAQRQGGHITRAQLLQAGVPARTITDWVARGRLIRVHRGVYAVGHRSPNPIDRAHAALLAAGRPSALTGAAALVLWGVWKRWPERFEVLIVGDRRPAGLVVHRITTIRRADIRVVQGLRVASPARTLLDTASRLSPSQLGRAVSDLRLRRLLTLDELGDIVDRNRTHPSARLLREHLEHAHPEPTRSELEDRFLPLLLAHGLPVPQINVGVAGHRVDALFPDQRLVVELDGWGSHRTRERFVEDRRRDFAILLATGMPTVRLPSDDVTSAGVQRLGRLLRGRAALPAPSPDGAAPCADAARLDDEAEDRFLHALAHATRRRILVHAAAGEQSISALTRRLELNRTTVRRHVSVLERAELVRTRRSGREQLIAVRREALPRVSALLGLLGERLDSSAVSRSQTR